MSKRVTAGAWRPPLRRLCGPLSHPLSSASSLLPVEDCQRYVDPLRQATCLQGFKSLYDDGLLLDVTLLVADKEFKCHRSMLASASSYFRAMFTSDMLERSSDRISINGVEPASMEQVMEYLYTGEAQLAPHTVQNIFSTANLFQLVSLRDGCAAYMSQHLDSDNCIGIYFFAKAHQCDKYVCSIVGMLVCQVCTTCWLCFQSLA